MSVKSFLLCGCLCFLNLCSWACPASAASAGRTGGYTQEVKNSILPHWTTPKRALSHSIRVLLEINAQGALKNCLVIISSGSDAVDASVCKAAQQTSPFTAPPSRSNTDVFMTFGGESHAEKDAGKNVDSADIKPSTTPKPSPNLTPTPMADPIPKPTASPMATAAAKPSPSSTVPQSPPPSPVKKETHKMTHAGIDYSKPKPTPLGVEPLATGLVGVTLPPETGDTPSVMTEKTTPHKGQAPQVQEPHTRTPHKTPVPQMQVPQVQEPKVQVPQEPVPQVQVHTVQKPETSEDDLIIKAKPEEDGKAVEKARPYAEGKVPFIQNNRRGQVMDENDFYINQIIARVRKIVQFPLGMKPGVVSAAVNVHISASGAVIGADISRSSRNKELDAALVDATKKVTRLPQHPSGMAQTLYLIFMVETPH